MLKTAATVLIVSGMVAWGQEPNVPSAGATKSDRAAAYYYYAVAQMYAQKAAASGGSNKEYVKKAVENFKAALNADPSIPVTDDALSGVYRPRLAPLLLPQPARPGSK
jgi:hypothetical protein